MGGNWLSNQLIKSENVATLSTPTATTSSVAGVIGTIKDKIVKTSSETISHRLQIQIQKKRLMEIQIRGGFQM